MSLESVRQRAARSPLGQWILRRRFHDSGSYWEQRYAAGGTSGAGSYGADAEWKAEVVNGWVAQFGVSSVIDFGCGDGNQLSLAHYPRYLGLDRSATAVRTCIARFADDPTKSFFQYDPGATADPAGWLRADLALSLEVIFHLVEDDIREDYLTRLFAGAERFVVICAADRGDLPDGPHERHRPFTPWIAANQPQWDLVERLAPPAGVDLVSELFLYRRTESSA
ncbi:class I SAM-dependent methyltransferase [Angustibacter luteus]|uniref:Class I SAM-dependent methyltransferase n=1 Tax=Angustibacter luteus TaxID=658456 RepID=A0ABW1JG76_9ACTN